MVFENKKWSDRLKVEVLQLWGAIKPNKVFTQPVSASQLESLIDRQLRKAVWKYKRTPINMA